MNRMLRFGLAVIGVVICGFGALTLAAGKLHYANWFHSPVFAPYAVIVGLMVIAIAIYGVRPARRDRR